MSTSKPIIPPDSPLHRSPAFQGSKLFVTVIAILTVHAVILAGLLIQGCKREEVGANKAWEDATNEPSSFAAAANSNSLPPLPGDVKAQLAPAMVPIQTSAAPLPATPPAGGVFPPTPTADVMQPAPRAAEGARTVAHIAAAPAGPVTIYVVKPGDTLTKIAKAHGTTPKAIRAASNLKTDRILVSQKLKIPAPGAAQETVEPSPTNVPR